MKIKSLLSAALAATALSTTPLSASAATILADPFLGSSFSDLTIGTIHIGGTSNLSGNFFAASSVAFPGFSMSLQQVTFTSGTVGSLTDLDPTPAVFNFHNVASGDYLVKASGFLSGPASIPYLAFVGANYTVTAVPEPESYAMLLAGLGLMGAIVRRRNNSKSA